MRFVCAVLFYKSSTVSSGFESATRAQPSLAFINHTATVNGRIILLLVLDWEVSPVTLREISVDGISQ